MRRIASTILLLTLLTLLTLLSLSQALPQEKPEVRIELRTSWDGMRYVVADARQYVSVVVRYESGPYSEILLKIYLRIEPSTGVEVLGGVFSKSTGEWFLGEVKLRRGEYTELPRVVVIFRQEECQYTVTADAYAYDPRTGEVIALYEGLRYTVVVKRPHLYLHLEPRELTVEPGESAEVRYWLTVDPSQLAPLLRISKVVPEELPPGVEYEVVPEGARSGVLILRVSPSTEVGEYRIWVRALVLTHGLPSPYVTEPTQLLLRVRKSTTATSTSGVAIATASSVATWTVVGVLIGIFLVIVSTLLALLSSKRSTGSGRSPPRNTPPPDPSSSSEDSGEVLAVRLSTEELRTTDLTQYPLLVLYRKKEGPLTLKSPHQKKIPRSTIEAVGIRKQVFELLFGVPWFRTSTGAEVRCHGRVELAVLSPILFAELVRSSTSKIFTQDDFYERASVRERVRRILEKVAQDTTSREQVQVMVLDEFVREFIGVGLVPLKLYLHYEVRSRGTVTKEEIVWP